MDHLWGVICVMQKWGVLTPLTTDGFNPLYASPLPLLSCVCAEQEEVVTQNEGMILELQVQIDRPKTLLQDKKQELQRKVSGLPIDLRQAQHTYEYTYIHTKRMYHYIWVLMCTFGFSSSFLLIELKEEGKKRLAVLWAIMPWPVDLLLVRENKSQCLKMGFSYSTYVTFKMWINGSCNLCILGRWMLHS